MFTITLTSHSKKSVFYCISIMHHFAFHSLNSESHKFFFSIKGQPVSKVVRLFSSKVNSHLQHSCKQKERTYLFEQEIHEHSRRGNNTPGRVKEIEYPGSFTGSFAVPARARTTISTASTTGSKDAV
jgi:hypothetical protein